MPITPANLTASVLAGLAGSGFTGQLLPTLASGVGNGVAQWVGALTVVTTDVGTGGAGTGILPWLVPQPVLTANMLAAYAANAHVGMNAAQEATGIATGLAIGFAQGLITTTHPTVGTGAGTVLKITGAPAISFLLAGFASVGIKGESAAKKANAISQALDQTLAVSILVVPIVGPTAPYASSGAGFGRIV